MAIQLCPNLQLGYLVRAKAYQELGLFENAIQDSQIANHLNIGNRRGLVAEKLTRWRIKMCEANLHVLANCAISALEDSNVKSSKLLELTNELRSEIAKIPKDTSDSGPPLSMQSLKLDLSKIDQADFQCTICLGIFHDPVTCPCGHTWCRKCIYNSIDSSPNCPLCRLKLPNIQYFVNRKSDQTLISILNMMMEEKIIPNTNQTLPTIMDILPKSYEAIQIPLFVCSLVFPGSTPSFQMFEPRYRVSKFN